MSEFRQVEAFWTVQRGQRWSVSLSEAEARQSLQDLAADEVDPQGWTIECSSETVPVTFGKVEQGFGETISLEEDDSEFRESARQSYVAVYVFWECPLCGGLHNCNLFRDPLNQTGAATNPSLWFCESGRGIVLVGW